MSVASTRIAVYPGTFDPVTNGHVDLVERAAPLFERLVVGVAESPGKKPALPLSLRVSLASEALSRHANVEVRGFDGLLAYFVRDLGAGVLLRGLRAVSSPKSLTLVVKWPMRGSARRAAMGCSGRRASE